MQCNTKTYKRNKQLSDLMNVTPVMVSKLHWYKWWCWQSSWSFQLQKNNRRFGFLSVLGVLFFLRFLACFCGRLLGFCGRFAGFCGRFSEFPDLRDFAGVCVQNKANTQNYQKFLVVGSSRLAKTCWKSGQNWCQNICHVIVHAKLLGYFGFTYGTSAVPLKDAAKGHIQSHRKPFVWLPGQHAHLMNVVQIMNITPTWPYQVTIQGINLHTSLQKSCCFVLRWLFHIFWKRFLAAHIVRVLR